MSGQRKMKIRPPKKIVSSVEEMGYADLIRLQAEITLRAGTSAGQECQFQ